MPTVLEWIAARKKGVVSAAPDETVASASQKMRDNKVGSLIVLDESGMIAGIVTERDVVNRSTASSACPDDMQVADVMTPAPVSCSPTTSVSAAAHIMARHHIRHLPIVGDGRPVGMISSRDILAYQLGLNKAMRAAAEEVALTGTNLRSLDLEEVLELVIAEVPKVFRAGRSLVHFTDDPAETHRAPVIRGSDCPWQEKHLRAPAEAPSHVGDGQPGPVCGGADSDGPSVVIPLATPGSAEGADGSPPKDRSMLCMCALPSGTASQDELLDYEMRLVGDIIRTYLGHARIHREACRAGQIDPLTSVPTRQLIDDKLSAEYHRGVRHSRPFCAVMVDVDHFKSVNDRFGHDAGDRILRAVAGVLQTNTRPIDAVGRYGGDEFIVIMPETRLAQGLAGIERLREVLERDVACPDGRPVTVSCGIAEWSGSVDDKPGDIVRRADIALYDAKHAGRNRVASAVA